MTRPKVALVMADGRWSGWRSLNPDGPTRISVEFDEEHEGTVVSVLVERPGGLLTGELLTSTA